MRTKCKNDRTIFFTLIKFYFDCACSSFASKYTYVSSSNEVLPFFTQSKNNITPGPMPIFSPSVKRNHNFTLQHIFPVLSYSRPALFNSFFAHGGTFTGTENPS